MASRVVWLDQLMLAGAGDVVGPKARVQVVLDGAGGVARPLAWVPVVAVGMGWRCAGRDSQGGLALLGR